ncbi:MAG TPA: NADH-quinone oxidoreductase subunit C [Candidatus Ozemobacteraceae bacterium]|nr:NADH-quinone oxidoreductase subunit C [Candidatus Ozemobacteraceae bacterium]
MQTLKPLKVANALAAPASDLPEVRISELREWLRNRVNGGANLSALFACPVAEDLKRLRLVGVMSDPSRGSIELASAVVEEEYPALTPDCPAAHWFEREIAEQWGLRPLGHPWLKPIRFHRSYRPGFDAWDRSAEEPLLPCVTNFYRVEGDEVHEVAVGPVHAGVIEPGHFRFQCHGENVFHLEISLGYQHRGIERALRGGPTPRTQLLMETLAGDTTIGHGLAYVQLREALGAAKVPARAHVLRGIALELERLANHVGDLGALANDVGFLPTASYCGRLRGDFLNLSAMICGSRFGRNLLTPGGVRFDLDAERLKKFSDRFHEVVIDTENAIQLLWDSSSVLARFEQTGTVPLGMARDLGLVGVAGRASGIEHDVRKDFPRGIFQFHQIPVSAWSTGDVFGRAYVRWLEIQRSEGFIKTMLRSLPATPIVGECQNPEPGRVVVSLTEGWRGAVCHAAMTDAEGRFLWYKVVDPSFHNWMGLAMALRGQQISDFPLCNKSFNLSYCGHDL